MFVGLYFSVYTQCWPVCTDQSVLTSLYRSACTGQRVPVSVYQSVCTGQFLVCTDRSVFTGHLTSIVVNIWSVRVVLQEKSSGRTAHYKLTSTAMLWLQTNKEGSGTMNLGGSLTRQASALTTLHSVHGLIPSNGGFHLQRLPSLVFFVRLIVCATAV